MEQTLESSVTSRVTHTTTASLFTVGSTISSHELRMLMLCTETQIEGIGETGMSRAEEFEAHENKASLFDLSSDPFSQLSGQGHRASVSGPGIAAVASGGTGEVKLQLWQGHQVCGHYRFQRHGKGHHKPPMSQQVHSLRLGSFFNHYFLHLAITEKP